MRRSDFIALVVLLPLLCGCRLNRPDDVLSPKKMEQFLYDFHMAQAVGQELPKEEKYVTDAYVNWAYSKNGITKSDLERSLVWYTRYPKELARIYKRLSNRIEDEYKSASRALSQIEKKSIVIQSGDSVDLWYLDRTALLNTSDYMNKVTYRFNSDTTFHTGDTLRLGLYGTFVSVDSGVPQSSYISLSAYYGDSISTVDTVLSNNGPAALYVILDSKKEFSSISGSINYLDSTDNRGSLMMVSGLELMRFHKKNVPEKPVKAVSEDAPAEL